MRRPASPSRMRAAHRAIVPQAERRAVGEHRGEVVAAAARLQRGTGVGQALRTVPPHRQVLRTVVASVSRITIRAHASVVAPLALSSSASSPIGAFKRPGLHVESSGAPHPSDGTRDVCIRIDQRRRERHGPVRSMRELLTDRRAIASALRGAGRPETGRRRHESAPTGIVDCGSRRRHGVAWFDDPHVTRRMPWADDRRGASNRTDPPGSPNRSTRGPRTSAATPRRPIGNVENVSSPVVGPRDRLRRPVDTRQVACGRRPQGESEGPDDASPWSVGERDPAGPAASRDTEPDRARRRIAPDSSDRCPGPPDADTHRAARPSSGAPQASLPHDGSRPRRGERRLHRAGTRVDGRA